MRRIVIVLATMAMIAVAAAPAGAHPRAKALDGPDPAFWLSDPDGVDGVSGTEQFDPVVGSSGWARVYRDSAKIRIRATGLEPGHTYTMWVVYFNDGTLCEAGVGDPGCNGPDLGGDGGGGVIYGTGRIGRHNGTAVFTARLRNGAGSDDLGPPPPPFAFRPYEAGPNNEFHVVIRSHGPIIWGQLREQLTTFSGGCSVTVGPSPEQIGDFPVPLAPGECGDVQLYVFK